MLIELQLLLDILGQSAGRMVLSLKTSVGVVGNVGVVGREMVYVVWNWLLFVIESPISGKFKACFGFVLTFSIPQSATI